MDCSAVTNGLRLFTPPFPNKIGLISLLKVEKNMKSYLCVVCGLIYEEEFGWPDDGIKAGTKWEDVPEKWECPDCGVGKSDFEMIEI